MDKKNEYQDEGLRGNEKIEEASFFTSKRTFTGTACAYIDRNSQTDAGGGTTDRCRGTGPGTGANEVTDSEDSGR